MDKKYLTIIIGVVLIVAAVATYWWQRGDALLTQPPSDNQNNISLAQELSACNAIPYKSIQEVADTSRLFINLPKSIYPKDIISSFITVRGNATAGWVSNGGLPGEGLAATPECWSTYYEFDGNGEVDLRVKSTRKDMPDYFVRFFVGQGQRRAHLYENCAKTEIPLSDNTNFDPEKRIVTLYYGDEKLQDGGMFELPYEPETDFTGCSGSAKSFLKHIQETVIPPEKEAVFCTQEAKLCPDGSYVGRTGPNCEFTSCPGE